MKLYQCPDCKTIRAEPDSDAPDFGDPTCPGDRRPPCCGGPMEPVAWWGSNGQSAAWKPNPPLDSTQHWPRKEDKS